MKIGRRAGVEGFVGFNKLFEFYFEFSRKPMLLIK